MYLGEQCAWLMQPAGWAAPEENRWGDESICEHAGSVCSGAWGAAGAWLSGPMGVRQREVLEVGVNPCTEGKEEEAGGTRSDLGWTEP